MIQFRLRSPLFFTPVAATLSCSPSCSFHAPFMHAFLLFLPFPIQTNKLLFLSYFLYLLFILFLFLYLFHPILVWFHRLILVLIRILFLFPGTIRRSPTKRYTTFILKFQGICQFLKEQINRQIV